ncbi:hypothetical protein BFX06_00735 [Sulfobacillus thermosulfidooxidans]|nr:hypothetical protein BFX05_02595 [Sulfobacillus thermosulfidooxidans]OLZ17293.1 hypothetical protein BFX06_00735 [Sulfobacillus thermosulfidooxidans]OLZ19390.1 hypothetical protein BFX07_03560 [Sulfobacillus thermosulfidooxidans]
MPKQALEVAWVSTQEQADGNRFSIPHHGQTPQCYFPLSPTTYEFRGSNGKILFEPHKNINPTRVGLGHLMLSLNQLRFTIFCKRLLQRTYTNPLSRWHLAIEVLSPQ